MPRLTWEIRQALTAGVAVEAQGRDIPTLAAGRATSTWQARPLRQRSSEPRFTGIKGMSCLQGCHHRRADNGRPRQVAFAVPRWNPSRIAHSSVDISAIGETGNSRNNVADAHSMTLRR